MRYASLSNFSFEPVAEGVDLESVAVAYTTPQTLRERLYNLGSVANTRAHARFHMTHDSTQGTATVRLTDGVNPAVETEIDLSSSPVSFREEIDVSIYRGSTALYWEIEITDAGSTGAVGRVIADMKVETPLYVSTGQC